MLSYKSNAMNAETNTAFTSVLLAIDSVTPVRPGHRYEKLYKQLRKPATCVQCFKCPFRDQELDVLCLFSERLYAVARRLSVGNAREPYSVGCNFRQYFYGICEAGQPLTSTENFMEIVPGESLRWRS